MPVIIIDMGGGSDESNWGSYLEGDDESQEDTPPDENPGNDRYDMPGDRTPGLQIRVPEEPEGPEQPPRSDIPPPLRDPVWN